MPLEIGEICNLKNEPESHDTSSGGLNVCEMSKKKKKSFLFLAK